MLTTLDILLIIYIALFVLSIAFLSYKTKKQTGIFPIMRNADSVYGFVDKIILLSYLAVITNAILYIADIVEPIPSLHNDTSQIIGIALLTLAMLCMFIAQMQMGKNWRIGVDTKHKTELVKDGFFKYFRHPIYFFALLIGISTIVVIPALSTFFIFAILWMAISTQSRVEEQFLTEKLGRQYTEFIKTRKRWF